MSTTLIKEIIKMEKKVQRFQDLNADLRKKNKVLMRQEISLEEMFNSNNKPFKFKKVNLNKNEYKNIQTNGVCLILSDVHINKNVSNKILTNAYNMEELNKRIKKIIQELNSYPYKSKNLNLFMLGDILEGIIHNGHLKGELSITESMDFMYDMIMNILDTAFKRFEKITLHCVMGNHSRITERAEISDRKHEDFEQYIYNRIKTENKDNSKLSVNISNNGYLLTTINKKNILSMHGDQDRGLKCDMSSSAKMQIKCERLFNKKFNHMLFGHFHSHKTADSGFMGRIIQNGAVPPMDNYVVQSGFSPARSSQTLFFVNNTGDISNIQEIILD